MTKRNNEKMQYTICPDCKGRIYKHRPDTHVCKPKASIAQQVADTTPMPQKKRVLLKLKETKLGVTLVLSLDDCKALGFTGEEMTREVVRAVRQKLGLPVKGVSA